VIHWSYIQHTGTPIGVPFFIDTDRLQLQMPRNNVKKQELEVRLLKMKNELYNGSWSAKGTQWHDGAHTMLNRMLEMLQEYRD